MYSILDELLKAFCNECHQRMQLVSDIAHAGMPLSPAQLDELHQEYDTLKCGARALNLTELENYFRIMASYSRYLRNRKMSDGKIVEHHWDLFVTGVEMVRLCNGDHSCCLKHCSIERHHLLYDIEKHISMESQNENFNS